MGWRKTQAEWSEGMIKMRRNREKPRANLVPGGIMAVAAGILCLCLVEGCGKKATQPQPQPTVKDMQAMAPEAPEPAATAESAESPAATDPLAEEYQAVQDELAEVGEALVEAEQATRRDNPEVRALFEEMMAKRDEYQRKLNEIDEIRSLRTRHEALRERFQELFDQTENQSGEQTL